MAKTGKFEHILGPGTVDVLARDHGGGLGSAMGWVYSIKGHREELLQTSHKVIGAGYSYPYATATFGWADNADFGAMVSSMKTTVEKLG
jgi:hypothetical protein